jgi:hypothetical protein
VNIQAALRAVENEVLELSFEIGLEEFGPEHLRVGDEGIGPAVPDVDRLVDKRVRLRGLLDDGVDACSRICRSRCDMEGRYAEARTPR